MILFFLLSVSPFSFFRPSDNPWIAISTLPDFHLSKKIKDGRKFFTHQRHLADRLGMRVRGGSTHAR